MGDCCPARSTGGACGRAGRVAWHPPEAGKRPVESAGRHQGGGPPPEQLPSRRMLLSVSKPLPGCSPL